MKPKAVIYRMVMEKHICPYGQKAVYLLKKQGFDVEDHHLTTHEDTEAFKTEHGVKTTPQTFINGERIGGYDDLKAYFGVGQQSGTTYRPVLAIFAVSLLMAAATNHLLNGAVFSSALPGLFIAFSMCTLAIQKLTDLEGFSLQFLNYDLLAQKWVPYSRIYPFAEAFAGIGMIAMVWTPVVALVALFIGGVGAASVYRAVYIQKRELKCACVGGNSKVPLGFVSMTENLMMVAMGLWMLF
tara:strand:+ start:135 stop:857 length:723 start_codon:yes stop_codon:yes gene_type:complete